ncbi:hypothetical protein [Nonomuraea dietziae]|uniref:hypothetical protein n=1 Tax=Nonomuraea dietziae TaxID=65515 RepID=UPI0031DDFE0F
MRVELVEAHSGSLIDHADHRVLAHLPETVTMNRFFNVTLKVDTQLRITSPAEGHRSQIIPVDVTCHKVTFSDVKATKAPNTCGNWALSGKITLSWPASLSYRWARRTAFSTWEGDWVTVKRARGRQGGLQDVHGALARQRAVQARGPHAGTRRSRLLPAISPAVPAEPHTAT